MAIKEYELYLDESGDFYDDKIDPVKPGEVSLVGGLLAEKGVMSDELAMALLPYHVHCCKEYKKSYLDVLEEIRRRGVGFVIFENRERLKVINGDTTYMNIVSEGLIKLLRDLSGTERQGISIDVIIATRKAVNAGHGILAPKAYRQQMEEKVMMALGRNHITGCQYKLLFEDARTYKMLDFADIICNTYMTRNRKKKFTEQDTQRIAELYEGQRIYPVFEDAMTAYLKQLTLERHYGEAIFQLCTLPKLSGFTALRNNMIRVIAEADQYEQETWFKQMSLLIGQYNDLRLYRDGIRLAENYTKYFLDELQKTGKKIENLTFYRFDTDYYLLTMYDHIGNAVQCQQYQKSCREHIDCIDRSWEHIDYYFGFCIRELNVLMGRLAFEEVLRRSEELIKIFTEARDLFSLIKTYNGTEQTVRSELLGKTYGVRLEALINLMHRRPELAEEAEKLSDLAIAEFGSARDLSRQYQWRCLMMVQAGKAEEALKALLTAADVQGCEKPLDAFMQCVYKSNNVVGDFLLWHYTNVLLLIQARKDPRTKDMANALLADKTFTENVIAAKKATHPWQLVLWNVARYYRANGDQATYRNLYRLAISIARADTANVTMLTFALSMSADRLLYCKTNEERDCLNAQTEFMAILKEITRAGLTEEMKEAFRLSEAGDVSKVENETLKAMAQAYLK